ncbi:hypothetical protein ACIRBX_24855 [Kitasatospora sp. NPDC096147]|uniref:hypothetical protein n=1 Tax=Kitasatospora sp. NPDC096147 TaxID=3364093 RepID=UPI003829D48B
MTQGRRKRGLGRLKRTTIPGQGAADCVVEQPGVLVPTAAGPVCCMTTDTEHVTLGGTVVRTRWHEAGCATWSAR